MDKNDTRMMTESIGLQLSLAQLVIAYIYQNMTMVFLKKVVWWLWVEELPGKLDILEGRTDSQNFSRHEGTVSIFSTKVVTAEMNTY